MSNKAKLTKAKEPVKLRFKRLTNGNQSAYLDIYQDGRRTYEFLKLYLVPELTERDRAANREMKDLATAIKAQRIVELKNAANGFSTSGIKQRACIYDYLQKLSEEKITDKGRDSSGYKSYQALIWQLKQYSGERTTFKQVNKDFCLQFIEYLKTAKNRVYSAANSITFTSGLLSQSTQSRYSALFGVALNRAVADGIIPLNPYSQIKRSEKPKQAQSNREYLTIEEIRLLVKTPCVKPLIKQAFLFSCFSGLRFSDVKALKWGDIQTDNNGQKVIRYTQQKTKKAEYLQLSDEALKYLPERGGATDKDIIYPLSYNGYANSLLKSWAVAAGIPKRVTFHVGRHTNATLLLSLGVPIETVSKLLGHSNIQTTQIYAKVIDKNKRDAVSKLDGLTD
jgi:integrase